MAKYTIHWIINANVHLDWYRDTHNVWHKIVQMGNFGPATNANLSTAPLQHISARADAYMEIITIANLDITGMDKNVYIIQTIVQQALNGMEYPAKEVAIVAVLVTT